MLLAAVLGAGCAGESKRTELTGIRDDQHRIADPGVLGALATGLGCATTRADALTRAQYVAQFNLRSLTGPARYLVHFEMLDEGERPQGYCIELSARAVAARADSR